jgi:hypothetical protein
MNICVTTVELLLQRLAFSSSESMICFNNRMFFLLFVQRDLGLNKGAKWASKLFHWQGISMA